MDELKQALKSDLEGAARMIGQALKRLHPSLDIYRDINVIDESVDLVLESLEDGDYDLKKER